MTNLSSQLNKSNVSGKKRALCFFWAFPALIKGISDFCGFFSREFDIEFFVVTNNMSGRMLLLSEGIQAFCIDDLINIPSDSEFSAVEGPEAEELLKVDLATGRYATKAAEEFGSVSYVNRVLGAYSLLAKTLQPDMAFVWNGAIFWQRALVQVAEQYEIPFYYMERGLFPDTFVVDPDGVNYCSSLAGQKWPLMKAPMPNQEENEQLDQFRYQIQKSRRTIVSQGTDLDGDEARKQLKIPTGAKVILLPLQIESDTNILFNSPFYQTMPQVIKDVQQGIMEIGNVFLVIKPHPEDKDRLDELAALCGQRCRLCSDLSLPTLLDMADVVITINSTVGLEALIQDKPVVALGRAIYTEKGFTFDITGPTDLKKQIGCALAAVGKDIFHASDFRRFLLHLLKHHLFKIAGNDHWGSRRIIGKQIASNLCTGNAQLSSIKSHSLEKLIMQNNTLKQFFLHVRSGQKKVLVFLPSSKTVEHVGRFASESLCNTVVITKSLGMAIALIILGRRYDSAISDQRRVGFKRFVFYFLLAAIRAERKFLF